MKIIYLNILKRIIRQKHLQLMSIIIVILYILVGINSAISYKNKIELLVLDSSTEFRNLYNFKIL